MREKAWLARAVPGPAMRLALSVVLALGLIACVVLFRATISEPFRIPAASMSPTLLVGDHVVAAKYRYGLRLPFVGLVASWDSPARGDVIVFDYPPDPSVTYVKRVVAIAGDRIAFEGDRIVLNGVRAPEDRREPVSLVDECTERAVPAWIETLPGSDHTWVVLADARGGMLSDRDERLVPDGHVFVAGDYRTSSEDSRRWGMLPLSAIKGKVTSRWRSVDPCTGELRADRFFTSVHGASP